MSYEDNARISQLIQHVESLEIKLNQLTKEINRRNIDEQSYMTHNPTISPGIFPKIAFDSSGLVLKGMELDAADIPDIQISQVVGLKDRLNSIADSASIKQITSEIKNMIPRKGTGPVASATKVNYDENGFVVSGSELSVKDIPKLPIEKIEGLSDIIDVITSMSDSITRSSADSVVESITKSGTYTKVSVDSAGRVVNGEKLTMNDLPIDFIDRINQLESMITNAASLDVVNNLSKSMMKKVDANNGVAPGTYTKVSVDSKGLVTGSSNLTIDDLPEMTIDCISGLRSELNQMAKYTDTIALNDSISTIMGYISSIGDINQVKTTLSLKADADTVRRLEKEFEQLKNRIASREESAPSELIVKRLDEIDQKNSTIEGRLAVLENRFK